MRPIGLQNCLSWFGVLALAASVSGQSSRPSEAPPAGTRPASSHPATQPAVASTQPDAVAIDPRTILEQLASTDWHQRKAATESLVSLGEKGKPFIDELIRTATTAEARNNAQAALTLIDNNRISGPSFVTLHLKNSPATQAIALLAPQAFSPLTPLPDNLWQQGGFGAVTIDVDHVPFWEVAPKIFKQIGVNFQPTQNNLRIMRGGGQMQGLTHVEGAFLVCANQINYQRTRMLGGGGGEQTQFTMTLSVFPEPKITILSGGNSVRLDEVVDNNGNSLIPNRSRMPGFMRYSGFGGSNMYVELQYPSKNPGTRIARFRGATTFQVQTKMRDFEVDNPMDSHDISTTLGGMEVTFRDLKEKDGLFVVHLSVPQTSTQNPVFATLQNQFQSHLRLLDARGSEFDHRGLNAPNQTPNTFDFEIQFADNNAGQFGGRVRGPGRAGLPTPNASRKPAKLVWEIPLESRDITVPIRFTDIPLFDDN